MIRVQMQLSLALAGLAILACGAPEAIAQRTVLRLWLTGPVPEAPDPSLEFYALLGERPAQTLHDWLRQIEGAADRDDIDGLALVIDQPELALAQVEELNRAIGRVRAAGKRVHAYLEQSDNAGYLLACAADHVTLAEHGLLSLHGLRVEISYYKGLMDWLGVEADLLACGDYKTAVEPYTRTEPSVAATEQANWLLNGQYERYLELMATGRGLPREEIVDAVDAAPLRAEDALERRLVDRVANFAAFRQLILKEYGADARVLKRLDGRKGLELDFENPFALLQVFQDAMEQASIEPDEGVALIYVDGMIVPQVSGRGPFAAEIAGSTTIRAALDEALRSEHIKSAVLRVNSPGGSALASDIIWKAAKRFAREKPLIVSMGAVAGSGGYYVACAGDTIFAEASTITGSIGVFGGKVVFGELMKDNLGVTTTEFTRGGSAALMSPHRRFDEAQRRRMRTLLNRTYEQFKQRVAESRSGKLVGDLEELAGGRVYTGAQALEHGLVDQIGGLGDALRLAASRAGLSDPPVYVLPEEEDLAQMLARVFGEPRGDEFEIDAQANLRGRLSWPLAQGLFERLAPRQSQAARQLMLSVELLRAERAACWHPLLSAFR